MTDARDKDGELDNHLRGGSALSRQYGAASTETPPAGIDARILAAARQALQAGPSPRPVRKRSWRWRVPVAAVAAIVLSVTLTLRLEEQKTHEQSVLQEAADPAAVEAKRAAESAARVVGTDERKDRLNAGAPPLPREKTATPAESAAVPAAPVESAAGSLARPLRDESLSRGAEGARKPKQELFQEFNAPVMKPPASPVVQPPEFRTPEAWLDHIRELRKAGRLAEAAAVLDQFKKAHPDYALPADLR